MAPRDNSDLAKNPTAELRSIILPKSFSEWLEISITGGGVGDPAR